MQGNSQTVFAPLLIVSMDRSEKQLFEIMAWRIIVVSMNEPHYLRVPGREVYIMICHIGAQTNVPQRENTFEWYFMTSILTHSLDFFLLRLGTISYQAIPRLRH